MLGGIDTRIFITIAKHGCNVSWWWGIWVVVERGMSIGCGWEGEVLMAGKCSNAKDQPLREEGESTPPLLIIL